VVKAVWQRVAIVLLLLFVFGGCSDKKDVYITFYDKNITNKTLPCIRYSSLPKNSRFLDVMEQIHPSNKSCRYWIELNYKNKIHCNTQANAVNEALGNFPTSYIKLELRDGMKLLYSYYKDLPKSATEDDVKESLKRLLDDIKIVNK